LALSFQLSGTLSLPATHKGIVMGQDLYFLGYPYAFEDLYTHVGDRKMSAPLPFIKRAILSSWTLGHLGIERMFLDGHNNPGFSGGPVVFTQYLKHDFSVAAVVSGFVPVNQQVRDESGTTSLYYQYNTGIVIAYSIEYAMELIKANPVGFDLS